MLQKQEDCRKRIPIYALLEDYLRGAKSISLVLRLLFQIVLKLISIVISYGPPIILTQVEDGKYLYLLVALSCTYGIQAYEERKLQELIYLLNAKISAILFKKQLAVRVSQTFEGILKELRQVERATRSFVTLIGVLFELPLVFVILEGTGESIFYAAIISMMALLAASVAQLFAWKLQLYQDKRLRMTQDVLSNVKSIKYLQWEERFSKSIQQLRKEEFSGNTGIQYVDTAVNFFRRMTQIVLLFVAFYRMSKIDSQFYTYLIFFDRLVYPINTFPWCLGEFLGSLLSIIRIRDYLSNEPIKIHIMNDTLSIEHAQSHRIFDKIINKIRNIHPEQMKGFKLLLKFQEIPQNKLTCIIGQVGCGKSLVLEQFCNGAYVPQTPWVFTGSVRENILFGQVFDEDRYAWVKKAVAIDFDDNRQVGLNGQMLSGGQRQRIAIARALYVQRDSYFLDDVFSAVDENIADHIFKTLKGLNKTVVVVVNQLQYVRYSDYVIEIVDQIATLKPSDGAQLREITFKPSEEIQTENTPPIADLITKDETFINYQFYFKALGWPGFLFFIIASFLQQGVKSAFELWIHSEIGKEMDKEFLIFGFLVLTALTLIRGFSYSFASLISARKIFDILLRKVLQLKVKYFDVLTVTYFTRRLFNDMSEIDDLPLNWFFSLFLDAIALIVIVAQVNIIVLPICVVVVYSLWKVQKHYIAFKQQRGEQIELLFREQDFTSFIIEVERGIKVICHQKQETYIEKRFSKIQLAKYVRALSQTDIENSSRLANFIIECAALLIIIISADQLTCAYAYLLFGGQQLSRTLVSSERVTIVSHAIQRIRDVLQLESEVQSKDQRFRNQDIVFKDVHLAYGNVVALKGISFTVKKGQKIAFCGRTGSGKSSIFNILVRLYEHSKGDILFNGNPIQSYSVKQLREQMSVIPQHGLILDGSILENIDPEGQFTERIQYLMKEAQIDINLQSKARSEGEKQIVNFLQSLLQDRKIILLDEATSNMDPMTNDKIMASLMRLTQDKTLLLISHRLENLQHFDQIHVLRDGLIVESGTYEQLLHMPHFNELRSKL